MYRIKQEEIKIYGAGKTWAAEALKDLRAQGFNIISRWIDLDGVLKHPGDTFSKEIHENEKLKREIWENGCKKDCITCDLMFMITTPVDKNTHSGTLVETGHVTAFNKPVYIIGTCESVEPVGNSDRAWKSQSIVHHWPNITNPTEGIKKSILHYRRNYRAQWLNRNMPTLNKIAA